MADFRNCILVAEQGGEISREEADQLRELYDGFERQARAEFGEEEAARQAARQTSERLDAEVNQRKREALITAQVTRRIKRNAAQFRDWRGRKNIADFATQLLEHHGRAGFSSVEGRRKAILGAMHSRLDQLFQQFTPNAIGQRPNQVMLREVGRYMMGDNSVNDPIARAIGDSLTAVFEDLRVRYNRAGGAIAKRKDWGLPQTHNGLAVMKAGREQWKADIRGLIDPARMRHPLTDEPIFESELDQVLDHVFDSISSDGWSNRTPSRMPFGLGSLASRRQESRFLVFKDFDSWERYQTNYGGSGGDLIQAAMHHIDVMARDLAAMEILGPNPNATMNWLKQTIQAEAGKAASGKPAMLPPVKDAKRYVSRRLHIIENMFSYMRGSANSPVDNVVAGAFDDLRNVVYSAKLGSAVLSSVGDMAFGAISRAFLGLPAAKVLQQTVGSFSGASRSEALAAGLIVEHTLAGLNREARYSYDLLGHGWSRWLAQTTMNVSGLGAVTRAGREGFGKAVLYEFGKHAQAGRTFENLPAPLRQAAEGYGITARDWEVMKSAGVHVDREVPLLRPQEIEAIDRRVAEKYLEMVLSETEYAVPSSSVRAKVALIPVGAKAGTAAGVLARSAGMLKSFSSTVLVLHGFRILHDVGHGRLHRGAAYAGGMVVLTGLLGGLSLQLKLLAGGKDPRDMNDPNFWGASILQGGGLGILGDFLFSDINRFGGGLGETLGGPMVGLADDFRELTFGNVLEMLQGKETNFGKELVQFGAGLTPGSTLWYARLGWERLIVDNLRRMVDPEADASFRAKARRAEREGAGFWWRPGQAAPDRAPRLTP